MTNRYDELYQGDKLYWGVKPSKSCDQLIEAYPAGDQTRVLVVGCGEGRNAIYLAKRGYHISAFDLSPAGIEKTKEMATRSQVVLRAFVADIRTYQLGETFDIIFSTGAFHYANESIRPDLIKNYKDHTSPCGIYMLSVFIDDPSIEPAPDAEPSAHLWRRGELQSYYSDWIIESERAEVFDCNFGGQPHRHAVDRILARRPE